MTPEPQAPDADGDTAPDKPFLPRWAMWLVLPAAAGPVLIFGFVLFTERAHDPTRCPFAEVTRRDVGPALAVIESARHCVEDVEERRWSVERDGRRRVLGNRRLDRAAWTPAHYHWTAKVAEDEVQVTVVNEGHGHVIFREGTPAERERDGR